MSDENLIIQLIEEIIEAIQQEPPSLERLEKLLQDAKDLTDGSYYNQQPLDVQDQLKQAKKDLEEKIRELKGAEPSPDISPEPGGEEPPPAQPEHDPRAEKIMNDGESAFYAGRYREAIDLYNQALKIEPTWERARQHRDQAQEYVNTGHIPMDALPPEAAIAFGKAQSAANLMNLKRARELLDEVKGILADHKITRFVEGQEFENKLNRTEAAENGYKTGVQKFNQGEIEEAISAIQMAADTAGVPLYKQKLAEYIDVRDKIKRIRQELYGRTPIVEMVLDASAELNGLQSLYSGNPVLQELIIQQKYAVTQISEKLFALVQRKINNANNEPNITMAKGLLEEIQTHLESLEETGKEGELAKRLANEEKRKMLKTY
jgi:tetratricopeptide (TPR) repeat protein